MGYKHEQSKRFSADGNFVRCEVGYGQLRHSLWIDDLTTEELIDAIQEVRDNLPFTPTITSRGVTKYLPTVTHCTWDMTEDMYDNYKYLAINYWRPATEEDKRLLEEENLHNKDYMREEDQAKLDKLKKKLGFHD